MSAELLGSTESSCLQPIASICSKITQPAIGLREKPEYEEKYEMQSFKNTEYNQEPQHGQWNANHDYLLWKLANAVGQDIELISMLFHGFSRCWLQQRMRAVTPANPSIDDMWTCQQDLALISMMQLANSDPRECQIYANPVLAGKEVLQILRREEYLRSQLSSILEIKAYQLTDRLDSTSLKSLPEVSPQTEERNDYGNFSRSSIADHLIEAEKADETLSHSRAANKIRSTELELNTLSLRVYPKFLKMNQLRRKIASKDGYLGKRSVQSQIQAENVDIYISGSRPMVEFKKENTTVLIPENTYLQKETKLELCASLVSKRMNRNAEEQLRLARFDSKLAQLTAASAHFDASRCHSQ